MLPESLIWALESFEPSYVTIDCGPKDPKVVSKAFDEIFRENWENAFEQTTEEVGVPYEEDDEYYAVKDVKQADEIKESDSTFSGKKPPAFFMKMATLYADKSKGEQEVVEYAEVIMLVFKILGGIAIFLFLFWIGSELLLSLD